MPDAGQGAQEAKITPDDVRHVAKLARLDVTDEEVEVFTGQLEAVLQHARDVEALDVHELPPTAHPLPLSNVFREDRPRPGLDPAEVLAMAPAAEDGRFRVPRILGEAP